MNSAHLLERVLQKLLKDDQASGTVVLAPQKNELVVSQQEAVQL
eukprot:CAMPEP_0197504728 /NCGR_PEP_ID=MMETSP1312-20131121/3707_1 /TAXON_ID=464262 /ORGANISM="Genus nov. species nov., Strain RCC2335" /LENGTH=43 /DNA_ID= /DNA_START= /DNA_END= /DNA_ORIENTATION=